MKEKKKSSIIVIILLILVVVVMIVLAVFLINKTKEEPNNKENNNNDGPILIVDISEGFKSRYSAEELNGKIHFKDLNYMRETNIVGYSGTIKKMVITSGCNNDDLFIIIAVLTNDGLYAILLDEENYYSNTTNSYELLKISESNDIDTIYAGSNLDENVNVINEQLMCYRYPYVRYSDGTQKAIEPNKCESNYYCAGKFNLINIK